MDFRDVKQISEDGRVWIEGGERPFQLVAMDSGALGLRILDESEQSPVADVDQTRPRPTKFDLSSLDQFAG